MKKEILEYAKLCASGSGADCKACMLPLMYRHTPCAEVFSKAITEHDERYKWHDLRKNPDDLPTEYTRRYECVILWFDGDINLSLRNATYISDFAIGKSRGSHSDVIAWREFDFEQFESEDELQ